MAVRLVRTAPTDMAGATRVVALAGYVLTCLVLLPLTCLMFVAAWSANVAPQRARWDLAIAADALITLAMQGFLYPVSLFFCTVFVALCKYRLTAMILGGCFVLTVALPAQQDWWITNTIVWVTAFVVSLPVIIFWLNRRPRSRAFVVVVDAPSTVLPQSRFDKPIDEEQLGRRCLACEGSGYQGVDRCEVCKGAGWRGSSPPTARASH